MENLNKPVPNFKTPIEKILFRSSRIGTLISGLIRHDLTAKQKERVIELESITKEFIGLTEGQQKKLNLYRIEISKRISHSEKQKMIDKYIADNTNSLTTSTGSKKLDSYMLKVSKIGELSEKQEIERIDFEARLVTLKKLTDNQQIELDELKAREDMEPELGVGAKTYIKELWLWFEKGYKEFDINTKYTEKGKQGEEDGITLVSIVDGFMYMKNKERKTSANSTGECDIYTDFSKTKLEVDAKVIDDIKLSFTPVTFMAAKPTTDYEWQGRDYMRKWGADIFRLRYCLVDCPPELLEDQYHIFRKQNKLTEKYIYNNVLLEQLKQGAISDEFPEAKKLVEQFYKNFLYENSGNYTKEERVKTFEFVRDPELEALIPKAIELALEYYKTITLNMIE
jgi:hypothetical protein